MIEYFYPKMSSLIEKLKKITINYFLNADENGLKDDNVKKSLLKEIYEFMDAFNKNSKDKIVKFSDILESDTKLAIKMEKINIKCMKIFFGLISIEGVENEEDVTQNIYDYDEIEHILPPKENEEEKIKYNNEFKIHQSQDTLENTEKSNDDNDNKMDDSEP